MKKGVKSRMKTKQTIKQIKANGNGTRIAKVLECAIGTVVVYCDEPRVIVGRAPGVVDAMSLDFRKRSRFSDSLYLPIAGKMQVTVNW